MLKKKVFLIIFALTLLFPVCSTVCRVYAMQEVVLGGYLVKFDLFSDGPIIVSSSQENLYKGDVIVQVDEIKVYTAPDVYSVIDTVGNHKLKVIRNGENVCVNIFAQYDKTLNKVKLGFCMKDGISCTGTVTCSDSNGNYYALGHSVYDDNSKFYLRGGEVYKCKQIGIKKPTFGTPGRIVSRVTSKFSIGDVDENRDVGVRGTLSGDAGGTVCQTASRFDVKPGVAQIYSEVVGEARYFDIEIIKTYFQAEPSEKGIVLRITDENLLNATGGILQGMSGSPILQNGKLVGAVTHVFTNDSTYGYGIYSDWLLSA